MIHGVTQRSANAALKNPIPHHFRHDLHAVASLQAESDIDGAYHGQEYGGELFRLHLRDKQMKRKCGDRKQRADNGRWRGKKIPLRRKSLPNPLQAAALLRA